MTPYWYQSVNTPLPSPFDSKKVEIGREHLAQAIENQNDPILSDFATAVASDEKLNALLAAVFGNSPFLGDCLLKDIYFTQRLLLDGPDACLTALDHDLQAPETAQLERDDMARLLRISKRKIALLTALSDITTHWPLQKITRTLADFAARCLDLAAGVLLREGHARGHFILEDPDQAPQKNSGLIILGMGKLGSRELNYSSDIDIIVLYDKQVIQTENSWDLQQNMVRLTKNLVRMLDERTADGYVFRTDLRLRPDPGSTPLALSVLAAETYYETVGQNWERAAMIKARPVAGDLEAGKRFMAFLKPFRWRKYMDFAAIQDIHAIKHQINAHKGAHTISLPGHNVKLGHGGIREIEFFVQTQQLIWGGRFPEVRVKPTCEALRALVAIEQVRETVCLELIDSYEYLRQVEHRIQMINDEQTHMIPEHDSDILRLSLFLGYSSIANFEQEFVAHLKRVESHYAHLFDDNCEDDPDCDSERGNLVFVGSDSDPATLLYLEDLGFGDPAYVDAKVRGWHHGRYRSTRSRRSREILTTLMPTLLKAIGRTAEPDKAFRRFDEFLEKLPGGIQLFAMFQVNPHLLELVAEIMGQAPRLADHLAKNSAILEYVLTPDYYDPPPDVTDMVEDLEKFLSQARDYEDILDLSRRWCNDRKFQVGVQTLQQIITIHESGRAQTRIAETLLKVLCPKIVDELAEKHGIIENGNFAIIALGKAGSKDMTATSDLDLIFVYQADDKMQQSNGERPLGLQQYYMRLSQRLINALSAPTAEGMLYEVDMRLRPAGNAGPIACSLEAFIKYHAEDAWTWEHMALTRARVIYATGGLGDRLEEVIRQTLRKKRDPQALLFEVADMRKRMDKEHHTKVMWDIKFYRGGIVDIDFITQYLILLHAEKHPEICKTDSLESLACLRDLKILSPDIANDLIEALDLWNCLQGFLRLSLEQEARKLQTRDLPLGLQKELLKASGEPSFDILIERIENTARQTFQHYQTLIDSPAEALPKKET